MIAAKTESSRVVITGVGVVSPVGIGKEAFWNNLLAGRSGIAFLKAFTNERLPCRLAAEVAGFNPLQYLRQRKLLKVMSRDIQLGVGAASLAMSDARLARGDFDPERLGVVYGAGRMSSMPQELVDAAALCSANDVFDFKLFGEECMNQICPLWLLPQLPNMPACHVSIENDARGPNNTITSREASPLLALAEAVHTIERGTADCMIVGACGSDLHPINLARRSLVDQFSHRADPEKACRPFDIDRDGGIPGEGAAAFVIEDYAFAHRRGADIYAEVLAVAGGCDGRGYQNGAGGMGLVRSITAALHKARLDPREIGHINADGKSTKSDDFVESQAYHRALGDCAETIPITGLKSYFGTFDAGAGAVELAASVLALSHRAVPCTLNYETPDPLCRLNVIHHEPLSLKNLTVMSVNRTAMGQSAAAILRAV
jgi:3-oxoacyl-[acyl-carrier-protein] synthase II